MRVWKRATERTARGVASAEAAIVLPILLLLLFGIAELGLMLRAGFELNSMTREAARALAAGEGESVVMLRISEAGTALDLAQMTVTLEFCAYQGSGTWSSTWQPVQSNGDFNTVPTHARVRARLTYNHRLLLPGMLPFLVDDPEQGTRTLRSSVMMMRT